MKNNFKNSQKVTPLTFTMANFEADISVSTGKKSISELVCLRVMTKNLEENPLCFSFCLAIMNMISLLRSLRSRSNGFKFLICYLLRYLFLF